MNNNDENNGNGLYSSYTDVLEKQINNQNQNKGIYQEEPKRSALNKIIIVCAYMFFIVLGYIAFNMYKMDKYEFYIKEPEVLLATNSSYQLELIPKNISIFDYKNYTYQVENTDIAEIDNYGLIKAKNIGTTKVKVKVKNGFTDKEFNLRVEDVAVNTIDFKESVEISTGESEKITPIINKQEKINKTVNYESTNSSVASVDSYGNVNAISEGSTKIVVRSENGVTGEVDVVIKKSGNEVQGVILTETAINIKRGNKARLIALVTPINAVNQKITWKSDNENVSVDQSGNIVAKNVGTSTITATSDNGKSATCKVTVTNETVQVTGVSLNASSKEMTVGQQDYLIATPSPSNATDRTIVWSSSNPKIVSVTDGKITALNTGSVVIIAKSLNGKTATCKINVKKEEKVVSQVEVTGVELNITNTTLDIGGTVNLSAKVSPDNATNKTVIWTSNNESVASVSNGTVTAKKEGTAVITAKSVNGKEASCVIIVRLKEIPATKTETTIADYQKYIQEVADAYYYRGNNSQYCLSRTANLSKTTPEQITSQNIFYTVCNHFISSIYYEAFGISVPTGAESDSLEYANAFVKAKGGISNSAGLIEYWTQKTDKNGNVISGTITKWVGKTQVEEKITDWNKYKLELIKKLNVGDIIVVKGHSIMIYDFVYNDKGEKIDAITIESTSNYVTNIAKFPRAISKASIFNKNTGVSEGTIQKRYFINNYPLSDQFNKNYNRSGLYIQSRQFFIVIRPVYEKNGKLYNVNPNKEEEFKVKNKTIKRAQYSRIYIEKTVDKFNNSIINTNELLTYTIKIKNNSNQNYKSFTVREKYDSQKVSISNINGGQQEGNEIVWNVSGLAKGAEKVISYTVKVNSNSSGTITSTGTVAGISSSTIVNTIATNNNLSSTNKNKIVTELNKNINSKKGYELINKIYKDVFNVSLNLNDKVISNLVSVNNKNRVSLNTSSEYYKMIINNYYGALAAEQSSSGSQFPSFWDSSDNSYGKKRARTIYKENLKTGDILIYKNIQKKDSKTKYEEESGCYYLVYVEDNTPITKNGVKYSGFIGIDNKGKIKNITEAGYITPILGNDNKVTLYYNDNIINDFQTILAKDLYVILRPSLVQKLK